jgi:hypothetical protein
LGKIEEGVYCTPLIDVTVEDNGNYSGTISLNGKEYNMVV